ncbi:hypothetical protein [Rhodoblastus sp.]|jgi:hypothetical protein|uniref:hypothetical protein n=1 Tax=Rhodoblastus sp. TaxID=1962975 RepID=UPI0025DA0B05|nr:hypothetical protein [Rhodoblastus sp.]
MKSPLANARFAAWALACLVAATVHTQARAECAEARIEPLAIDYQIDDERVLFDTTLPELDSLARAAKREAHRPLMAVYTSKVLYQADISVDVNEVSPGLYCGLAAKMRIRVQIIDRNIHVAREVRDQDCLVSAATRHARLHAENERGAYAMVETILRKRILPGQPFSASSVIEAKKWLTSLIGAQIDADMDRVEKLKASANQETDSAQDLARLRGACRNSI